MERGSRTRLMTAVLLVAVFGVGVLLGLAADSNLEAVPAEAVTPLAGGSAAEEQPPAQRRRIYDEVGPDERQLALIDSIVAEHRARTTVLDEEMRAQTNAGFRSILLETRAAIKSVLTHEQAAQYQVLVDEYDARRAAERAARRTERDPGDNRK